jgi:hypothetical protein
VSVSVCIYMCSVLFTVCCFTYSSGITFLQLRPFYFCLHGTTLCDILGDDCHGVSNIAAFLCGIGLTKLFN